MQDAQTYLEIVRSRGERGLELKRVYRNLQNPELFLRAYGKLYANEGALTPGTDPQDTVDGMSQEKIRQIIGDLRAGAYRWRPVRRVYYPKGKGKYRPLGIPNWKDKLLQEVMRIVLSAYYEPQFSELSHGFRPGRGCHTALSSIVYTWRGTKWFIEGDITGCFDNIDHDKLLQVIGRNIKDERFLKLLRGMLEAGYMQNWRYHQTYSGTPQGGVNSPLLANIFMNELDMFVENELMPQYNKGKRRKVNPEYSRLSRELERAKKEGDIERYKALRKERDHVPYGDPDDPDYRRLKYVRYADDFLLGFIGPKSEAREIKQRIGEFLDGMGLTLSEEKTLITHATDGHARFLGYDISMARADSRKCDGRRSINGQPLLSVPRDVVREWKGKRQRHGKPRHRAELLNNSDYDIVMTYNMEFQGLVNYYTMAYDVARKLYPVKYVYLQSLVKTLATKHKRKVTWVYRRYSRKSREGIKAIAVTVPREGKKPLVAWFGAKRITFNKHLVISDRKPQLLPGRNELVKRLLADQCEVCGSNEGANVHHIRKLKDLKRRYKGRNTPPLWAIRMIEIRRKTLVVCAQCHQAIHAGTYDGEKLK